MSPNGCPSPRQAPLTADGVLVRAVLYDFAVIGEAAKGILVSLRALRAKASWSEAAPIAVGLHNSDLIASNRASTSGHAG